MIQMLFCLFSITNKKHVIDEIYIRRYLKELSGTFLRLFMFYDAISFRIITIKICQYANNVKRIM